jgi:hypothetical protein
MECSAGAARQNTAPPLQDSTIKNSQSSINQPVEAIPYEDDEDRSDEERLVEEGVQEAEHDQMLKATKAQRKQDASREISLNESR